MGLTCAVCHATVDKETGKAIEGAANVDVDTGLLLAFATNSAAMFRQTGVNPLTISNGDRAPYLHDGGVAATALQSEPDGHCRVAKAEEMGMAGTWMHNRAPDPGASLRVLLDRDLRQVAVAANRSQPDPQFTHVDGIGHECWVDQAAGFSPQDQTDWIQFLLSLDDDPIVLPTAVEQNQPG